MSLSPADKLARRGLVTGSRIARILGLSPFGGPMSVYLELTEEQAEQPETLPQKRGRILEPSILQWHAEDAGCVIRPCGTLVHAKHSRIGATPDGIATYPSGEERIVEAKSADWRLAHLFGESGTDHIPEYYIPQVQFELGVSGLRRADVPVLLGANDFRQYVVDFDAELFAILVGAAERFLVDHVDARKPPPPDGSEQYEDWLKRQWPTGKGEVKQADPEAEKIAFEYRSACLAFDAAEEAKKLARQRLELVLGDAQGLVGAFGKISFRNNKDTAKTDWQAVALDCNAPESVIQRHTVVKAGPRVLRGSWK